MQTTPWDDDLTKELAAAFPADIAEFRIDCMRHCMHDRRLMIASYHQTRTPTVFQILNDGGHREPGRLD